MDFDISAKRVFAVMDELGIEYEAVAHEPVQTMEDCAAADAMLARPSLKTCFFKNLFLQNRQKTSNYLYMTQPDERFITADFSKKLGVSRLSFGGSDALWKLLGVRPGAITPMGLINDTEREVTLVLPEGIRTYDALIVHPLVNTASMRISVGDFLEVFLPHTGHVPVFI